MAPPDIGRALPAKELAAAARRYHGQVESFDSFRQAVDRAYDSAGPEDVILAFGSLSFLGEMTEIVEMKNKRERRG